MKRATKDQYEKEEEEVERLVRKSPEKKPPRHDRTRGRVKVNDPDLSSDVKNDKDMSMNYKDIGGSVAKRYLNKYGFEDEDDSEELSEDEDWGFSEDDDEEGSPSGEDTDSESEDEDGGEGDTKDKPKVYRKPTEEEIHRHAIGLYSKSSSELYDMLQSKEYNQYEKEAVKAALVLKTNPIPPVWDRADVFKDGLLTLKARKTLRSHVANWDVYHFAANLNFLKTKLLNESLSTGTEETETYYKVLIDIIKKEFKAFGKEDFKPIRSLDDILKDIPSEHRAFQKNDKKTLEVTKSVWKARLRRTNREVVCGILKSLGPVVDEVDDMLSVRFAFLAKLKSLLEGSLVMKKRDVEKKDKEARMVAGALRKAFEKAGATSDTSKSERSNIVEPYNKPSVRSSRSLRQEDYTRLLESAEGFLKKPHISDDLLGYNKEMAHRAALDYAIYTLDKGAFEKAVDANTYNDLLEMFLLITAKNK